VAEAACRRTREDLRRLIFIAKANLLRDNLVLPRMKGDRLGEFEELALLAVRALGDDAYGAPVLEYIERATGRAVTIGAVYAALSRLEAKGHVRSRLGDPEPVRGGKRKRFYDATPEGMKTVRDLRRIRERIWRAIDARSRT
jgi:DNA-binding PadR family transcriptional regulator